jgi:hypothetical protein
VSKGCTSRSKPAGRNKVSAVASSNYQPKSVWEGRPADVTAKAADSNLELERLLNVSGPVGAGTLAEKCAEQERLSPVASSGKDRTYYADRENNKFGAML